MLWFLLAFIWGNGDNIPSFASLAFVSVNLSYFFSFQHPDRSFHNYRAWRSGDRRILCCSEASIDGSYGSKIGIGFVGILEYRVLSSDKLCEFYGNSSSREGRIKRILKKKRKKKNSLGSGTNPLQANNFIKEFRNKWNSFLSCISVEKRVNLCPISF